MVDIRREHRHHLREKIRDSRVASIVKRQWDFIKQALKSRHIPVPHSIHQLKGVRDQQALEIIRDNRYLS